MAEARHIAAGPGLDGFDTLDLEKKIEQEKRRKHRLIREQNLLTFALTEKEAQLKLLRETLRDKGFRPPGYNDEDSCQLRKQQLEINIDKMNIKIVRAKDIHMAYQHIHEHLLQEVHEMEKACDRKEHGVRIRQAEVERARKQFQTVAAAAESSTPPGDWTLEPLSATSQSRQKEQSILLIQEMDGDEEKEEEAHSCHVTDHHQRCDVSGASQSDKKLAEDMEALREALGYSNVQELVHKVVSQMATQERLIAELTRCQHQIGQRAEAFAELELQHTGLKFRAGPSATRLDELRAELKEKALRVQRLQAELKQSQDLLDPVEQGVNNLYFRMSCVPVEGLPSGPCTDCMDQLKDIKARLPILLQRASEQEADSGLDQETVYTLHEQLNAMESRNAKTQSAPIGEFPPQLSDGEENVSPSHEEIKRCSSKLIKAGQKKKASRAKRKQ